jgi:hypothetical protein
MKTTVLYLHVAAPADPQAPKPDYYLPYSKRFIETYQQYPAGADHDLRVISCGAGLSDATIDLFSPIAAGYSEYLGSGWDIGAHQWVTRDLDCDLVMCFATPVHFVQKDWLTPFIRAYETHGDGLYGAMASRENSPHIRTSAYAFNPTTFRRYPHLIDSRERCFHAECGHDSKGKLFEGGAWSFTNWYLAQGKPVLMVTRDAVYAREQWRQPPNIFRRGDQSNCLVWDRHNDIYAAATPDYKLVLERLGDIGHYP